MKVVHLIKSLGRGGAEMLLAEGFNAVDHSRFSMEYAFYLTQHDAVAKVLQAQGACVHSFGASSTREMLTGVGRTARYLRETRADLVHAHLPLAGVVGRLAGHLAGVPVVYTEHNPPSSYHPLTQALSRATWGLQACAVAISEDVAASMRRHGGSRARIEVVHNGIDTTRFSPSGTSQAETRARLGLPTEAPIVGVVAQFRAQKRLDVWLAAARQIRNVQPDARFVIVGDGPLWDEIHAVASQLGLSDAVLFAGGQPDVRPYVEAMDVFVMTSAYEGFGLAPVEAMAMRVPVVSTAVDGIRSVISSGTDGVLVPPGGDVAERIAAAVLGLLADSERRRRLGVAGRASAVEKYGLVRMQRELEALYIEVVEGQAAGRAQR